MAEQNTVTQLRVDSRVVLLRGRLASHRRYEKAWYSMLQLPAADEYSRPEVVEVRSTDRLGEPGDMIDVRCMVGGYNKRPYRFTDKETGESRMVTPNIVTLTAI